MDLTKESFDYLLAWLNPDRDQAARKYEEIRKTLISIFTWRNLMDPEELADETINRVAQRTKDIAPGYAGDPALYFYGVAKKILLEQARSQLPQAPLDEKQVAHLLRPEDEVDTRVERECLSKCLDELPLNTRELVLKYYTKEGQRKIDYRRAQAERLGINVNALRVRMHRIRVELESCIKKCIGRMAYLSE